MQKVVIILLISTILGGCTLSKKGTKTKADKIDTCNKYIELKDVINQNITEMPFFIQKAEIELFSHGQKKRFFASVKYNLPDSFLISIRSVSGIEAGRIILTDDTVLINDRINKILYYGSETGLRNKYGFSLGLMPLFFGDLIIDNNSKSLNVNCIEGYASINSSLSGNKIEYTVNCRTNKAVNTTLTRDTDTVVIKYEYFKKVTNIIIPDIIYMSNINEIGTITIKISKIEVPWKGRIQFIPGSHYEKVEIR